MALNSIVPLFSSDNGIKLMRVFMGNLSSKMLKCHFVNKLWSKIYAPLRTLQHTMAANGGVTKAIASFFPTWLRYGLSYLCYDLRANIIPANFFWVKCVRFSPCHDRDFRKRPVERRLPKIFDDFPKRLPNVAEMPSDVPKTFELLKVARTDLFACWLCFWIGFFGRHDLTDFYDFWHP